MSTGTDWHWVRHWVNTGYHWVELQPKFTRKPVKTRILTKTSAIPVPKYGADAALALGWALSVALALSTTLLFIVT